MRMYGTCKITDCEKWGPYYCDTEYPDYLTAYFPNKSQCSTCNADPAQVIWNNQYFGVDCFKCTQVCSIQVTGHNGILISIQHPGDWLETDSFSGSDTYCPDVPIFMLSEPGRTMKDWNTNCPEKVTLRDNTFHYAGPAQDMCTLDIYGKCGSCELIPTSDPEKAGSVSKTKVPCDSRQMVSATATVGYVFAGVSGSCAEEGVSGAAGSNFYVKIPSTSSDCTCAVTVSFETGDQCSSFRRSKDVVCNGKLVYAKIKCILPKNDPAIPDISKDKEYGNPALAEKAKSDPNCVVTDYGEDTPFEDGSDLGKYLCTDESDPATCLQETGADKETTGEKEDTAALEAIEPLKREDFKTGDETNALDKLDISAIFAELEELPMIQLVKGMRIEVSQSCSVSFNAFGSHELTLCPLENELDTVGNIIFPISTMLSFLLLIRR